MGTGQTVGTGALTGAASGAAMGSLAGPWGAAIGGGVGLLTGALGGLGQAKADKAQQEAIAQQEAAIRAEMRQRAKGVGSVRAKFGDISSFGQKFSGGSGVGAAVDPSKFQDIGKTLGNRSNIAGSIEGQVGALRDAGGVDLTSAAQQGSAALRASMAARGLQGSSLETSGKEGLLGAYAGGRADLASGLQGARQGAWGSLMDQQRGFEGAANSGGNIQGQLATLSTQGAISGARAQQPIVAAGNLLNMGLGLTREAALASANGGQGWGALLPSINPKASNSGVTTAKVK